MKNHCSHKQNSARNSHHKNGQEIRYVNSGRITSSRRGSHQSNYLTQNMNKSSIINNNYQKINIHHKIIPNNNVSLGIKKNQAYVPLKNKLEIKSEMFSKDQNIQYKNRPIIKKQQKSKNCMQKLNLSALYSKKGYYKENLNSEQKQNICPNNNKRSSLACQKETNSFIKEKFNIQQHQSQKNKVIHQLSKTMSIIKTHNNIKDEIIKNQNTKNQQGQSRSQLKSFDKQKRYISSSRNSSFKKEQTQLIGESQVLYLKTKDTLSSQSKYDNKSQFSHRNQDKRIIESKKSKKNSLKLKSPSINHFTIYPSQQDEQVKNTFQKQILREKVDLKVENNSSNSIKKMLQILINSQNQNHNQIKRLIDSLTHDQTQEEDKNSSQNQKCRIMSTKTQDLTNKSTYKFRLNCQNHILNQQSQQANVRVQNQRNNLSLKLGNLLQNEQKPLQFQFYDNETSYRRNNFDNLMNPSHIKKSEQALKHQNCTCQSIQQKKEDKLIEKYEQKILSLYQALINQKQKCQWLENIIKKYITKKQLTIQQQ